MAGTYANGRSLVHQGDGEVQTCTLPDVCKTPSPGGPIPVPYVNSARDSALEAGCQTVLVEGHAAANASSKLSTSSGDEPGTAGGGLISGKTKGKLSWGSRSLDVRLEGRGAVRFMDVTLHNGNTFNSSLATQGRTGMGYGDDPDVMDYKHCERCELPKAEHRLDETYEVRDWAMQLAGMLTKYRNAALRPEEDRRTQERVYRGYAIGVLTCRCNKKIFAAMSGQMVPAFPRAVAQLARKNPRWTSCEALAPAGDGADFLYQIADGGRFRSSRLDFVRGAPPPGNCAAPRLIQKALGDGHVPMSMSELWFWPIVPVSPRSGVTVQKLWNAGASKPTEVVCRHLEPMPSCDTCKLHLTVMLCNVGTNRCK